MVGLRTSAVLFVVVLAGLSAAPASALSFRYSKWRAEIGNGSRTEYDHVAMRRLSPGGSVDRCAGGGTRIGGLEVSGLVRHAPKGRPYQVVWSFNGRRRRTIHTTFKNKKGRLVHRYGFPSSATLGGTGTWAVKLVYRGATIATSSIRVTGNCDPFSAAAGTGDGDGGPTSPGSGGTRPGSGGTRPGTGGTEQQPASPSFGSWTSSPVYSGGALVTLRFTQALTRFLITVPDAYTIINVVTPSGVSTGDYFACTIDSAHQATCVVDPASPAQPQPDEQLDTVVQTDPSIVSDSQAVLTLTGTFTDGSTGVIAAAEALPTEQIEPPY